MFKIKSYTSSDVFEDLDGAPSDEELARLVEYFPSYQKPHRTGLLKDMFDLTEHTQMVLNKLDRKGIKYPISPQAMGGHSRWVASKMRRTVIRLLFLRMWLDQGMKRLEARRKLFNLFPLEKDSIRYATRKR